MKTIIAQRLAAIAQHHDIKILYACESGSRGWGFPSPDSDYDVRFLYLKRYNDYLSVMEQEDSLGFAIDETLDINGWDLRKALQLMRKGNTGNIGNGWPKEMKHAIWATKRMVKTTTPRI